ncbi:MAG: PEP-CTERM sorting domain-containing protein [Sulfuritalea sp.]|nr:PEP-CTERM sorting domain-containing protein [Sulfuritalea sp.]
MFLRKNIARSLLLSLGFAPALASASVIGFLGNFDVINDTGRTANGFEIELEGLHSSDISNTFGGSGRWFPNGRGFDRATSVERYGAPSIVEYLNGGTFAGTRVTYFGIHLNGSWDYSTPFTTPGNFVTPGDNCWSGGGLPGGGYSASTPCDHFGVGTTKNASKTTYSWLYGDAAGNLTKDGGGVVSLPAPVWNVVPAPPPAPGLPPAPPVVVAQIQAPAPVQPPEKPEAQWGEAIWVKVFTTELPEAVRLEDLVGGNQKVDLAKTETEWQLLQVDPGNENSGKLESGYGVPVGPDAASILRRYEFYKFSGTYKDSDHQAMFDVGFGDSHPGPNDVGNYIGAQNAALNFDIAAVVPEPETYAMMLAGLGLLGVMARRRKQKAAAA